MNRRDSLKAIGLTTIGAGLLGQSYKSDSIPVIDKDNIDEPGREDFEIERIKKLNSIKFFDQHEMITITALANIIIPKDNISGSASDAKVPEFIEFIVKDIPDHQVPMRGGIKWLDMQCFKRYNNAFVNCKPQQQIEIVEEIAYPRKATPEMQQGVMFFNRMRNLTASGFYTTPIGIKDMGYVGNTPNRWDGVPKDVLAKYGFDKSGWG